ncbi:MAG: putative bifunctional diguanylate cyclase/phosphodiesterase [Granulosicoccus sp.]
MSIEKANRDYTKTIIGMGFLAVFSLMLLITWLSISTLQSVNSGMSALIDDMGQKTSRAYQMRDVIRLRSGAVRTLVQTENTLDRQRIFDKLLDYTIVYDEARNELSQMGANERERRILTQINEADMRVGEAYEEASVVLNSINLDIPTLRSVLNKVNLQELVLLNHLNELVKLEKQLADEALANNQIKYHETRELLIYIVSAAFALSIIISAIVAARVAKANQRIAHLANHDDLTGLHNRRSFEQHLQQTIAIASRSEMAHGLLYLDLDRFKMVNDTCGHHAGDQLLIQLTSMISERLRHGDLFARVGGDEFAIIAQANSFEAITQLAEELRVIINQFTFYYEDHSFNVSLSIGAMPLDGQIQDMEQVLADVDSACYIAKQSGRNQIHVTEDNDTEVVKYRSNLAGIQAIRKALADDRLSLYFQPVFEIHPQSISMAHCEILLRVRSENGELYSPARFIPIAEKYNVMTEIDRWVFTHVADWLAEHQSHHVIPRLLVNLSGLSFADEGFSDFIVERLSRGDIDPTNLAFEISEGAAVRNFEKASRFIERVRALGCELALDDFGSGFSNFAYLKKLSFDYLKIDGSLIRNIASNEIDRQMVAAINQIAHTVGARTIAEFVEDDASLNHLREMQVSYAQGYGLRMPTPLEQLSEELETKPAEAASIADSASGSSPTGSIQDESDNGKDNMSDNSMRKAS